MAWNGLVAVDLFAAGLGAWVYILAVVLRRHGNIDKKTELVAKAVALVCVALGAVILMVDAKGGLLHPLRLVYLLSNFGSVMSWGVVFISVFLLSSFVDVLLSLTKKTSIAWLEVVACVFAFGVSAYTGALLGDSPATPLWNIVLLPLLFVSSAALSGSAGMHLIATVVEKDAEARLEGLRRAIPWLAVLVAVVLATLVATTAESAGSYAVAGERTVSSMLMGSYAVLFWVGVVGAGLVMPIAVGVHERSTKRDSSMRSSEEALVRDACVLAGGFCLRLVVVIAAVPVGAVLF